MTSTLPRISVIIPVRNSVATIGKALESVCSQGYPNLELIVLDAVSDDGTLDVIKQYESQITHFRSAKDDGANDSYNEGIKKATGSIIGLLNADDWYEPGILQLVGEAYAADPSLDVVTSEAQVWKDNGDQPPTAMKHFSGKSLALNPKGTPMPNARFFNKTIFDRFGYFMVRNHLGQRMIASDLEFMMRLSQQPLKNHMIHQVGYHYLMHAGSLTFGGDATRERQMYLERAYIAKTYLDTPALAGYRGRLKRWHRRGTVRNFFWKLAEKDTKTAWEQAREGLAVSHAIWVLDALRTGISRRF
jgi:glycosyltransferase involved in cell wall biosynthesis